jgi:hypothetical protein
MAQLDVSATKTSFLPGEWIEGKAIWQLDAPADWLEVRLLWFTQGKGDGDISIEDTLRIEAPTQNDSRTFRFRLPHAPYSFSGKLISLIWAVEVVADGAKDAARLEFSMSPDGREIELGSVETPFSSKEKAFQERKAAYTARRAGKQADNSQNSPWSS